MGHHCQPPSLRKRKHLLCITLLLVVLSVLLHRNFQLEIQIHRPAEIPVTLTPNFWLWTQNRPSVDRWKTVTSFIAVNMTKTLLVSAYLEHRTNPKQVRVIAVVLRKEEVTYHCFLHCRNQLLTSHGVRQIHNDHFGFSYGTADIMCPLPSLCDTPSHVAVASAENKDQYQHAFLEVKNEKEKTESFNHTFTVCLSTMFDFTNVLQLVQSLEMYRLLGVNKVFVYKTNCSAETQRVLDYYTNRGILEVIPWSVSRILNVSRGWLPEHSPGDLHYFGQIPALNDCLYRNMYQSKYVALHDVDELILPQTVEGWTEMLRLLEDKYGTNKCYMFENNVFPNNVTLPSPEPHNLTELWRRVPGVNILAHLHQEPIVQEHVYEKFKIIVNPRLVTSVSVHGVLNAQDTMKGCAWVDRNIARMYHTRPQMQTHLTSDKLIYDGKLLSYSKSLIKAVDVTLRESNIL